MGVGTLFHKRTMRDTPLDGHTVLLRADYNVPQDADGKITDDFRIRASLPTVRELLRRHCKVVIISHLGRPDGKRDERFTLEPAADRLAKLLRRDVRFVSDCHGPRVKMAVKRAPSGSVTVLENVRFYPGEEANDPKFARSIAESVGADYFVQDAFGVVHRAHASNDAITDFLPSVAGLLLEREYTTITSAMRDPKRPLVALLGGAKVSDKLPLIKAFIPIADKIIVTGAMANTFLAASGHDMGASKIEPGQEEIIKKIYTNIKRADKDPDVFLMLPTDLAVANEVSPRAARRNVSIDAVGPGEFALDIGEASTARICRELKKAKTVIWNGTLGMAELPAFAWASAEVAETLADNPGILSIIGGGDTADFVLHWDKRKGESFGHISTGGGASLELMSGEKLPGIESLLDARPKIKYTKDRKA